MHWLFHKPLNKQFESKGKTSNESRSNNRRQQRLLHLALLSCHSDLQPALQQTLKTCTLIFRFKWKQQSDSFPFSPSFSSPMLLTPPNCQPLHWHPSFIWGPLGHISSQSSWHGLNQNGSFLPWNVCLAALMLSLKYIWLEKKHLHREKACSVHVHLCVQGCMRVCVLS